MTNTTRFSLSPPLISSSSIPLRDPPLEQEESEDPDDSDTQPHIPVLPTQPLAPMLSQSGTGSERPWHSHSHSLDTMSQASPLGRFNSSVTSPVIKPHSQLWLTSTGTIMGTGTGAGTRYGVALTGQPTGGSSARNWGGRTPSCGRCGKSVYFAEQVKAVSKTYHKGCLRCAECNTLLDSTRLTEKDGEPLCRRCYGKVSDDWHAT